jgi:hypothetical protein
VLAPRGSAGALTSDERRPSFLLYTLGGTDPSALHFVSEVRGMRGLLVSLRVDHEDSLAAYSTKDRSQDSGTHASASRRPDGRTNARNSCERDPLTQC